MDKEIKRISYRFNRHDNSGEQLVLETVFLKNEGDSDVFINQTLTLNSYGNSAQFNLYSALLDPNELRELANRIESAGIEAKQTAIEMTIGEKLMSTIEKEKANAEK